MPTEPDPTTLDWYQRLPTFYRDIDETLGEPLLRWMALLGNQVGAVTELLERIDSLQADEGGTGAPSQLADPVLADDAWLPWLAQFVGINPAGLTVVALRAAVGSHPFRKATKEAIVAAVRPVLTGSQFVAVYDHTTNSPGDGGAFDVLIVTRITETPDSAEVIPAVIAAGQKPAGVLLHYRGFAATWAAMVTAYPTWADRNGRTWLELEEVGL